MKLSEDLEAAHESGTAALQEKLTSDFALQLENEKVVLKRSLEKQFMSEQETAVAGAEKKVEAELSDRHQEELYRYYYYYN